MSNEVDPCISLLTNRTFYIYYEDNSTHFPVGLGSSKLQEHVTTGWPLRRYNIMSWPLNTNDAASN